MSEMSKPMVESADQTIPPRILFSSIINELECFFDSVTCGAYYSIMEPSLWENSNELGGISSTSFLCKWYTAWTTKHQKNTLKVEPYTLDNANPLILEKNIFYFK